MTSTKGSGLGKRLGSQSRGSGSSKNDNQYNHDGILEPHTFTLLDNKKGKESKATEKSCMSYKNPQAPHCSPRGFASQI
jgi:hypothetical protein